MSCEFTHWSNIILRWSLCAHGGHSIPCAISEQGLLYPPPASVTTPSGSNLCSRKAQRVSANTWEKPTDLRRHLIRAALRPTPEMLMAATQLPSAQACMTWGDPASLLPLPSAVSARPRQHIAHRPGCIRRLASQVTGLHAGSFWSCNPGENSKFRNSHFLLFGGGRLQNFNTHK